MLGYFNCVFENNSLKGLFGQNMKKLKISKLSQDFRYLQEVALKLSVGSFLDPQRKRSPSSGNILQKAIHIQLRSVWEASALLITLIKKR